MDRIRLISDLHPSRLVAVVRSKSADEALALARAAAEGGIKFVEITFSVPGALDVIKELAGRKDLHVGAGTVLAPQQAERAIGAGAQFVVSPSLELNLIGICHTANIACFPGAATPSEIIAAQRARADLVKIFPADLSGGVNFKNVAEYVRLGVTGICLGSAYLGRLLAQKGRRQFVKEMQRFVKSVGAAQAKKITTGKRSS